MGKLTKEEMKEFFNDTLMKTNRNGVFLLLNHLEEIGFYTAPSSTQYHLCCEGGLLEHTVNVMKVSETLGRTLLPDEYDDIHDSVMIAAALHDVGKCGQFGKALYVPNILKSGELSKSKPYETNKELLTAPHEIVSAIEAIKFIDISEAEQNAILWHNGLYGIFKYEIPGKESKLYMLIHWADMWSSRIIEKDDTEKKGDH